MSSSSDEETYNDGIAPQIVFHDPPDPSDPIFDANTDMNDLEGARSLSQKDKDKHAVPNGTEANGEKPNEQDIDTSKLEIKFVDQTYVLPCVISDT